MAKQRKSPYGSFIYKGIPMKSCVTMHFYTVNVMDIIPLLAGHFWVNHQCLRNIYRELR